MDCPRASDEDMSAHLDLRERGVPRGQQRGKRGAGEVDLVEAAQLDLALRPDAHRRAQRAAVGAAA